MIYQSKTDKIAADVFKLLLRDFRRFHGQGFATGAEEAFDGGIAEFRDYAWPSLGLIEPARYKAWLQLQQLFKRYRFSNDKYTSDELDALTVKNFLAFQERRSVLSPWGLGTSLVLKRARTICRDILGKFVDSPHCCMIGKRATLNGPRHDAYIDSKLGVPKSFTCPSALRKWFFKDHLPNDPVLSRIVKSVFKNARKGGTQPDLAADYLNLVLVPKSWKTHRPITPLSLVGLYYSYMLGNQVSDRLRENKLDIRHLQRRHQRLAKRFSETRSHVTADLSSASDSITSSILNAVLPRDWYVALKRTFIRKLRVDGVDCYTESVLPMGNGATFPVETLIFYCIIKAVGDLLKVRGTFSVYGDDLIYPRKIHSIVVRVFGDLGFGINYDKTFVDSHFRESCGGDFYRGIDVRPALLPERTSQDLNGLRYQQFIYKVLNSLRRRWSDEEIPGTISYLLTELSTRSGMIFQVPPHFPDTSGLKVSVPFSSWYIPFLQPSVSFADGSGWFSFKYIGTLASSARPVVSETPFYWDKLRIMANRPSDWREQFSIKRQYPTDEILTLVRRKGKGLICCPSLSEGKPRIKVCAVSNWTQGVTVM